MLPASLQSILDDIDLMTDRQDRIDYLIGLAESFRNPSPAELPRTAENRVPGCESEAYVLARCESDRVSFLYAVDNPQGVSAMALAVILASGLSKQSKTLICEVPEDIVTRIFGSELSMGKSLGLTGMIRMSKHRAANCA